MPFIHTEKGFLRAIATSDMQTFEAYRSNSWTTQKTVAIKDNDGNTGLHLAARQGNTAIISTLLSWNASIGAVNRAGETPLALAIKSKRADAVQLLLVHGADPNEAGGEKPLIIAIEQDVPAIVKLLLEKGANPKTAGRYSRSPLYYAAQKRDPAYLELLLAHGADPKKDSYALYAAINNGIRENIDILVAHGADLRTASDGSTGALHAAARNGNVDIIKMVLATGVDINMRGSYKGATALHTAAGSERFGAVEYLIAAGANPTLKDSDNQTAQQLVRGKSQAIADILAAATEAWNANPQPVAAPAPVISIPASVTAPALQTPAGEDTAETWERLGETRVVWTATLQAANRRLTEVFNFESRERLVISENLRTGAESMLPPESFDTIATDALKRAYAAYKNLGGPLELPEGFDRHLHKTRVLRPGSTGG